MVCTEDMTGDLKTGSSKSSENCSAFDTQSNQGLGPNKENVGTIIKNIQPKYSPLPPLNPCSFQHLPLYGVQIGLGDGT